MHPELDEKLCKKYPEIFADRHADMRTTAMCWGFDCEDGWYAIIDTLCALIMWPYTQAKDSREHIAVRVEEKSRTGDLGEDWANQHYTPERLADATAQEAHELELVPRAVQVKEKFGTLRFYLSGETDRISTLVAFASSMSARTCEVCGDTSTARIRGISWVKTLCDKHTVDLGYNTIEEDEEE